MTTLLLPLMLALAVAGAGLPGWMGFATARPGKPAAFGWSPGHREADVVVFSAAFRADWEAVARGTAYRGVTAEGAVALHYLGTSDQRYGCDRNTQTMTAFRAGRRLPEGLVWVLPADASLKPVPVRIVAAPARQQTRSWTAGGLEILLRKTGALTALLRVTDAGQAGPRRGGREALHGRSRPISRGLLGRERDRHAVSSVCIRVLDGRAAARCLPQPGYEGSSFRTLLVEDGRASFLEDGRHSPFLYFCAF